MELENSCSAYNLGVMLVFMMSVPPFPCHLSLSHSTVFTCPSDELMTSKPVIWDNDQSLSIHQDLLIIN